jgi:hypothetical protein
MDFLVGDYVLAKKHAFFEGFYKSEIKKDKVYKIDRIHDHYYCINQFIFDKQEIKMYFYTKREVRELKLKKLKEI